LLLLLHSCMRVWPDRPRPLCTCCRHARIDSCAGTRRPRNPDRTLLVQKTQTQSGRAARPNRHHRPTKNTCCTVAFRLSPYALATGTETFLLHSSTVWDTCAAKSAQDAQLAPPHKRVLVWPSLKQCHVCVQFHTASITTSMLCSTTSLCDRCKHVINPAGSCPTLLCRALLGSPAAFRHCAPDSHKTQSGSMCSQPTESTSQAIQGDTST
jgi:hypothetical protein